MHKYLDEIHLDSQLRRERNTQMGMLMVRPATLSGAPVAKYWGFCIQEQESKASNKLATIQV
jgi:hypothetical protein